MTRRSAQRGRLCQRGAPVAGDAASGATPASRGAPGAVGVPEGGVPEGGVPEGGVPEGGVPEGATPGVGARGLQALLVRPSRRSDCPRIMELVSELASYERSAEQVTSSAADLEAALFGPTPAVFAHVAELESTPKGKLDGQLVGVAIWFPNFSTWEGRHGIYVEDLYVVPGARRLGVGRALLAELASIAAARDYRRLEWSVLDWNDPALSFYASLGAKAMRDWTTFRMSGSALSELAAGAVRTAGAVRAGPAGPFSFSGDR